MTDATAPGQAPSGAPGAAAAKPKVSVVVPIYNNEAYLRECLDSICAQTLGDLEAVCVNDGSTDGSLAIMRGYETRDSRFRVLDKPNTGYGDTLNQGFSLAKGDYLTVLESDDVLPPDACQAMYDFAVSQDLDFLKADAETFLGEPGSRTYTYEPASENPILYEAVFDSSADPGRYFARGGQPGLYKASFLKESGAVFHDSPGATFQDTSFWAQVMFAGKRVRYLAKSCYLIRRDNPGSSVADHSKTFIINGEYDFVRERIDHMPGIDRQKCLYACAYYRYWNYRWTIGWVNPGQTRAFLQRFAEEFKAIDEAGELDRSYFSAEELEMLEAIMADPDAYYFERWHEPRRLGALIDRVAALESENARLRAELDEVYASKRYALGSALADPVVRLRGVVGHRED